MVIGDPYPLKNAIKTYMMSRNQNYASRKTLYDQALFTEIQQLYKQLIQDDNNLDRILNYFESSFTNYENLLSTEVDKTIIDEIFL